MNPQHFGATTTFYLRDRSEDWGRGSRGRKFAIYSPSNKNVLTRWSMWLKISHHLSDQVVLNPSSSSRETMCQILESSIPPAKIWWYSTIRCWASKTSVRITTFAVATTMSTVFTCVWITSIYPDNRAVKMLTLSAYLSKMLKISTISGTITVTIWPRNNLTLCVNIHGPVLCDHRSHEPKVGWQI